MKVIVGGMEGASMWRVSFDICTKDIANNVKAIKEALKESGGRCDAFDFQKIGN